MAHDFSSITDMTSRAASHANSAKSAIGSHTDHEVSEAINQVSEAVLVLTDAINFLCDALNR